MASKAKVNRSENLIVFTVHGIAFRLGIQEAFELHVALGAAILEADPKKAVLIIEEDNGRRSQGGANRKVV